MALRGMFSYKAHVIRRQLTTHLAKPTTALQPFRVATASISSSTKKDAAPAEQQQSRLGLVKGNPGTPPPMKGLKPRQEVPLPSQEGSNGVMQYAL